MIAGPGKNANQSRRDLGPTERSRLWARVVRKPDTLAPQQDGAATDDMQLVGPELAPHPSFDPRRCRPQHVSFYATVAPVPNEME